MLLLGAWVFGGVLNSNGQVCGQMVITRLAWPTRSSLLSVAPVFQAALKVSVPVWYEAQQVGFRVRGFAQRGGRDRCWFGLSRHRRGEAPRGSVEVCPCDLCGGCEDTCERPGVVGVEADGECFAGSSDGFLETCLAKCRTSEEGVAVGSVPDVASVSR